MMIGLILLVLVAYYMFNSAEAGGAWRMNRPTQTHTALDILNERYAQGEINREDYLERKQELSGKKQPISIKKG